jgi:hypothetical protein
MADWILWADAEAAGGDAVVATETAGEHTKLRRSFLTVTGSVAREPSRRHLPLFPSRSSTCRSQCTFEQRVPSRHMVVLFLFGKCHIIANSFNLLDLKKIIN